MSQKLEVSAVEFPLKAWTCPSCGKKHSKPHFPYPDQLDLTKRAGEVGRIKFNRVGKDGDVLKSSYDTPVKDEFIGKQGNMYEGDKLQPEFCPHCGYTIDGVLLVQKKVRKKRTSKPKSDSEKIGEQSAKALSGSFITGSAPPMTKKPKRKKKSLLSRVKKRLKR